MGNKNNGAHTVCLVPYLLLCLEQAIPQLPLCGFFRLLIPFAYPFPRLLPPLQHCLPWKTAGSTHIKRHHAPPRCSDYRLLAFHHHCYFSNLGRCKERSFFINVFSEQLLAGQRVSPSAADVFHCHSLRTKSPQRYDFPSVKEGKMKENM